MGAASSQQAAVAAARVQPQHADSQCNPDPILRKPFHGRPPKNQRPIWAVEDRQIQGRWSGLPPPRQALDWGPANGRATCLRGSHSEMGRPRWAGRAHFRSNSILAPSAANLTRREPARRSLLTRTAQAATVEPRTRASRGCMKTFFRAVTYPTPLGRVCNTLHGCNIAVKSVCIDAIICPRGGSHLPGWGMSRPDRVFTKGALDDNDVERYRDEL